jgi:hypothetical protein
MGKQSNSIDQYREETADLTNTTGRRCQMSSWFSSPTLRLQNVLRNYCRTATARVSLGGADGATSLNHLWRTDANQEWGSEWEPIKNLLEGDGDSNKMKTASNTRLRLTTQVGQAHAATGVLLDLRTKNNPPSQNTPTHTAETCTACCLCCTSQTDVLCRPDQWAEPIKPVAIAAAQQVFQRASMTYLGPGTKTLSKHNLHRRKTLHKA